MNRVLLATTLAASLIATNLFAADAQGPLAPGKPAGVQKAQDMDWAMTALYVGAGALAVGLLVGSLNQENRTGAITPPTSTSTSSTTST
jgi:hypothetical protein